MGKFGDFQHLVDNFNEKYGLNFSYEHFETVVLKNKTLQDNFFMMKSNDSMEHRAYVGMFSVMYIKALTNYADRKIDFFNSKEIMDDYQNMMEGYKTVINQNGTSIKDWPKSIQLAERVQNDLANIPDGKQDYIAQRYKEGKFPIREMRAYVQQLKANEKYAKDPEKLSVVLGYSKALEEVNSQRSRWWRIIHPFRNAAEQREAKNFKKVVTDQIGIFREDPRPNSQPKPIVGATEFSHTLTDEFVLARAILLDKSIADAKDEIKEIIDQIKLEDRTAVAEKTNAKEKIEVKELVNNAPAKTTEKVDEKSVPVIDDLKLG